MELENNKQELLSVSNLSFRYPQSESWAIKDISLTVGAGEFVVLSGNSGCGKTTLLRLLKRELAPKGERLGEIFFAGKPQEALIKREAASGIGFVMQNPEMQIATDKVWHELAFGLENMGEPTAVIRRRVGEMANYFGIQSWFHKETATLSGGQKQLLNLASVLLLAPKLLLLDEPTSQLDPIAASDFIATLKKLNQELGIAVLLCEHRLEEVYPVADRAIVMRDGQILAQDTPRRLYFALAGGAEKEEEKEALLCGMPTALRVCFGRLAGKFAGLSEMDADKAPLSVREGRAYLRAHLLQTNKENKEEPAQNTEDIEKNMETEKEDEGRVRTKETPALAAKNVWFRYERSQPDVLQEMKLALYPGEIVSILGGNGSGKSTLLLVLAGLLRPYRGSVEVYGRPVRAYKNGSLYRETLAMLPQDVQTLFVRQTLREEFAELAHVTGRGKKELEAEIAAAAERLGLSGLMERHPYDLSGGEQQRAALAKLLLLHPRILLLDEPTKGVDAAEKQRLGKHLRALAAEGRAILTVTHDVEFAAQFSDRCGLFFDGMAVGLDTPHAFFGENMFYTTAARRMSRGILDGPVTCGELAEALLRR